MGPFRPNGWIVRALTMEQRGACQHQKSDMLPFEAAAVSDGRAGGWLTDRLENNEFERRQPPHGPARKADNSS